MCQYDSHRNENSVLCLLPVLAGKAETVELQPPSCAAIACSFFSASTMITFQCHSKKPWLRHTASLAVVGCGGYVWRSGGAVRLVTLPKSAPSMSQNLISGCNTLSPGNEQVPWRASEVNSVWKCVQTTACVSFVLFTACLQRLIKLNGEKLSQLYFFSIVCQSQYFHILVDKLFLSER